MNYVIIGNSAAAVGCVEAIRRIDTKGSISVISREVEHTYSRPLISYWLQGKVGEDKICYRDPDFYEKYNVTQYLGRTAEAIDSSAHTVVLDGGERIPYDKVLIATGSDPFVPPIPGLNGVQNKHTFMSMDDVRAIKPQLQEDSRVLIMGAGLIGLKAAEALHGKVKSLTVVDLAEYPLPSILNAACAAMVQKHIEGYGVDFRFGSGVTRFEGDAAVLASGEVLPFDILLVCVGVRPNISLAKEAGAEVERGIITADTQETSVQNVYAAGDCTESYDVSCDARRILALLPNAYMQGEVAGTNMAGGVASFTDAIPMNAIGFFGFHLITAGSYTGEKQESQTKDSYRALFIEDGTLKGFILGGDEIDRAGIYTSLIREKTPLSDVDAALLRDRPQLMLFGRLARNQKLGGVQ